jgi:fatty-acyl-CoA synthase
LTGLNSQLRGVAAVARAGLRLERPDRLPRAALALLAVGPTLAGALAGAAARYPNGLAIVDDDGSMTYMELWRDSDEMARRLRSSGVREQSAVGLLSGNGRGFIVALVAVAKLGADLVLLNPGFAGPQLVDVIERETVDHVVYSDPLAHVVSQVRVPSTCVSEMASGGLWIPFVPSRRQGRTVILTSGTTGRPKGARRGSNGPGMVAGLLACIPIRSGDTTVIAAPMFHAWGLAHTVIALTLASTVVTAKRFDAGAISPAIERQTATGLVLVPAMLQRILDADRDRSTRPDTSSLRYIASSGSSIPAPVVVEALQRFGPVLYNTYGSTEAALATIAGPADLAGQPRTAGRVVPGVTVQIINPAGQPAAPGSVGRIFVGSGDGFEGYTDGGDKQRIDGMVSTGDVGHFDGELLFVDGRDDDMIVSGAENVFPSEVEDVISEMAGVTEVAVVGVDDRDFGQRLAAYVVKRPGIRLTKEAVRDHVRDRLARYKVPRDVHFVTQLPRTESGKIRHRDLT